MSRKHPKPHYEKVRGMPVQRFPIAYATSNGKAHPIYAPLPDAFRGRAGLHPYVGRASVYEPILTPGQKLTPEQKIHLEKFNSESGSEQLAHLESSHGLGHSYFTDTFTPSATASFLEQASSRYPDLGLRGTEARELSRKQQNLVGQHLALHLTDIEERVRTAPNARPLTPHEYEAAGVDVAPGFTREGPIR